MYLGELNHHGKTYPGEHPAIVPENIFNAVQANMERNRQTQHRTRTAHQAPLTGKVFDERGNLMTPTYSSRGGVRYRYYSCRLLIEGRREEAGTVKSVSAPALEEAVQNGLKAFARAESGERSVVQDGETLNAIERVTVFPDRLQVFVTGRAGHIDIPWARRVSRPKRQILLPHADASKDSRPIKSEVRENVVSAIALGRRWLSELTRNPDLTIEALAIREDRSKRSVNMFLSLNFLAPPIVSALLVGKLPRGIGITRLVNLPSSWSRQYEVLGLMAHGRD
jgi:hypothetical protein